jgi:hypothetical protein
MSELQEKAADLLEQNALELYRITDDKDVLDRSLEMAEALRDAAVFETEELDESDHLWVSEGDRVEEVDGVSWSRGFEVVEVTGIPADEYTIDTDTCGTCTVARYYWLKNRVHVEDDTVVLVTPIDGSDKEYAYPVSQLRPLH